MSYAVPAAPLGVSVKRGRVGSPLTVRMSWDPPSSTGGTPVSAYDVIVWKARPNGKVVRYGTLPPRPRRASPQAHAPAGRYKFAVAAEKFAGTGLRSARTPFVRPR